MYTGKGYEGTCTYKCKIRRRKKLQLNRGGEFRFYNRIPYSCNHQTLYISCRYDSNDTRSPDGSMS